MKTKTVLVCEKCESPILRKDGGFAIQGAIYPADANSPPILGTPIPPNKPTLQAKDIGMIAYCTGCFAGLLGFAALPASQDLPGFEGQPAFSTPAPTNGSGPVMNVGATQQLAPGAFVNSGPVLPTKGVDKLPALTGPPRAGDTVRVTKSHRFYEQLRGKAARVERFREDDGHFVLAFSQGAPMLAKLGEIEKIG